MSKLVKQAIRFLGLSGIGWLMDFFVYGILEIWSDNLFLNNLASSWMGVTFVFLFSTRYVFQDAGKIPLQWKYGIYLLYQFMLILLVSRLLGLVNRFILENFSISFIVGLSVFIAKMAVTPITMILNFIVMKTVIEKL